MSFRRISAPSFRRIGAGVACVAAVAALALPGAASAAPRSPAAPFGRPVVIRLPAGAAASPQAGLDAVSCPKAGDCTAAGTYTNRSDVGQVMVVSERGGHWQRSAKLTLPGGTPSYVGVHGVACTSPGDCWVVGNAGNINFIARQEHGHWSPAFEAQLPATADVSSPLSALRAISCASRSFCVAAGEFTDMGGNVQGMAVTYSGGHWNQAVEIAEPAGGPANPTLYFHAVSCPKTGHCVAGGTYSDTSLPYADLAMAVATMSGGSWGRAVALRKVPAGLPAGPADIWGMSCPSAGNCSAIGQTGVDLGFALRQQHGRWQRGVKLPRTAGAGYAAPNGISCMRSQQCVAVGFTDTARSAGHYRRGGYSVLWLRSADGRWGSPLIIAMPRNTATGKHANTALDGVDCTDGGACVAVGLYTTGSGRQLAIVISRR
jgi:hypothetical protein